MPQTFLELITDNRSLLILLDSKYRNCRGELGMMNRAVVKRSNMLLPLASPPNRQSAAPSSSSRNHQNFQKPLLLSTFLPPSDETLPSPGTLSYPKIFSVGRRKFVGKQSLLGPEIGLPNFCSIRQNSVP
jgi:hypothetical protein